MLLCYGRQQGKINRRKSGGEKQFKSGEKPKYKYGGRDNERIFTYQ